jgi:putative lipoic acid-binding regulatory protein
MNGMYWGCLSICLLLFFTDKAVTSAFKQVMPTSHDFCRRFYYPTRCESIYYSKLSHRGGGIFRTRAFKANQDSEEKPGESESPIHAKSTFKIDDRGSDLTDRFKYKVHALMGDFDPLSADSDNEYTDGNILNALLQFPTSFIFNVVGKTNGNKESADEYIKKIRHIVQSNSGDENIMISEKPRGKNFTKIEVKVTVQSSSMITRIFNELGNVDETVMRF